MELSFKRFSLRSLLLFVLLAGSVGGLWYRWEPWVCVHVLGGHTFGDRPSFNSDYTRFITSNEVTKSATVYETASGKKLFSIPLRSSGHKAEFASSDKFMTVWFNRLIDAETGKDIFGDAVTLIVPDKHFERCVIAYTDKPAEIWDLSTRKKLKTLSFIDSVSNNILLSDDGYLVVVDGDVWDWRKEILILKNRISNSNVMRTLSKDGRYLLAVYRVDSSSDHQESKTRISIQEISSGRVRYEGEVDFLNQHQDSKYIYLRKGFDKTIAFSLDEGKVARTFDGFLCNLRGGESSFIITLTVNDKTVHFIDRDSGTMLNEWKLPESFDTSALAFGDWVLSDRLLVNLPAYYYSRDSALVLDRESDHRIEISMNRNQAISDGYAISPDKTRILSVTRAPTEISICDLQTGEPLFTLPRYKTGHTVAFFFGSEPQVCTASDDCVCIWHQRRDERTPVWQLPELWLAIVLLVGLGWSVGRDVRGM